jgi:hypothetical protein
MIVIYRARGAVPAESGQLSKASGGRPVRLSTALPVCCGSTTGEAQRRATALGEAGARLPSMGVIGAPADVTARAEELAPAGADTL